MTSPRDNHATEDERPLSSGDAERLLRRVHAALSQSEQQRRDSRDVLDEARRLRTAVYVAIGVSITADIVEPIITALLR